MDAQSRSTAEQPSRLLRLIAVFKFCKAALLGVVALGAFELLRPEIAASAQHWVDALASTSDRRLLQRLISFVTGLSPGRLEVLGAGAVFYAGLFSVEGVGLWLGRWWAEYLTVIATALFMPLEVFEIARHASAPRLLALALNLAVVIYLVYRLRRRSSIGGMLDAKPS